MIDIKRILCPVDFSDLSRRALEYARTFARYYESEIVVLYVESIPRVLPIVPYGGPIAAEPLGISPAHRDQLMRDLAQFLEPAPADDPRISCEVTEGLTVEEVLTRARTLPADLVVIGTHGRSGFERLMLGSVTERVLRKAPCPVLTVPPRATGAAAASFSRILCAVDFSDSSLLALQYALSLAQEADAKLAVVHVLEGLPEAEATQPAGFDVRGYRQELEDAARERLAAAIPDATRQFCAIEELVVSGKAYHEILRLAESRLAELIVLGVRGRGAIDLMMFGSTAQQVARQATCPVLTLRAV